MMRLREIMSQIIDSFRRVNDLPPRHEVRSLTDEDADRIIAAIEESESPTACRICGRRGHVQLSGTRESDGQAHAVYLCYEDLGPFLELFADPAITDFTVVRL